MELSSARYKEALAEYRKYLAMTLTLDDMMGGLLDYLDRAGKAENTIVVFTSDHGSQMGGQGIHAWSKKMPYEESIHVPLLVRSGNSLGSRLLWGWPVS